MLPGLGLLLPRQLERQDRLNAVTSDGYTILDLGRPIKWVQTHGGWSSAKLLLDTYGHFLPREMGGSEDVLAPQNRNRPEKRAGHSAT